MQPKTAARIKNIAIAAVAVLLAAAIGLLFFLPKEKEPSEAWIKVTNNNILFHRYFYRHSVLYYELCKENGYPLDNYVRVFKSKFHSEIKSMENVLKILEEDNPGVRERLDARARIELKDQVDADIDAFRKYLLVEKISKDNNMPVENVEWNDWYYQYLTIDQTCREIDRTADDVLGDTYELIRQMYVK